MGGIERYSDVAVFNGFDVGKQEHHATALGQDGKKLYDKPLPNTEADITEVFIRLAEHGPALVIVDQPATISTLPVAFAQDMGVHVGYLPGLDAPSRKPPPRRGKH